MTAIEKINERKNEYRERLRVIVMNGMKPIKNNETMCRLRFVLINSVLLNLLCVCIKRFCLFVCLFFKTADFNRTTHIIIMYIYHALINALGAHMIHINLNMIFYTHVEHSPIKTIYIKY